MDGGVLHVRNVLRLDIEQIAAVEKGHSAGLNTTLVDTYPVGLPWCEVGKGRGWTCFFWRRKYSEW